MEQLRFFNETDRMDDETRLCHSWLREQRFDIRKRLYEDEEVYHQRIRITAFAFNVEYKQPEWSSIEELVDICPLGECRLPMNKKKLPPHQCYFLKLSNLLPENWNIPHHLEKYQAQNLPKRATYRPRSSDTFLSRFKEPLGKCVICNGEIEPLYVTSNLFLLRPKDHVPPYLVLALLKSAFVLTQLHYLIRQRSVITEMFIKEVPQIMVPNLSDQVCDKLIHSVSEILKIESESESLSIPRNDKFYKTSEMKRIGQLTGGIDKLIMNSLVFKTYHSH